MKRLQAITWIALLVLVGIQLIADRQRHAQHTAALAAMNAQIEALQAEAARLSKVVESPPAATANGADAVKKVD